MTNDMVVVQQGFGGFEPLAQQVLVRCATECILKQPEEMKLRHGGLPGDLSYSERQLEIGIDIFPAPEQAAAKVSFGAGF